MKTRTRNKTVKISMTALFAALIAVGAFIRIPIPLVPFTLQFCFVNLAALFLGKKWGTLAFGIYLVLGLIGVPIFTRGGGLFYVLQPTFGYLIGFLAGAFASGLWLERVDRTKYKNLVIAGFINAACVYPFGILYFYLISTLYFNTAVTVHALLVACFLTTIWSDIIFIFFTAFLAQKINRLLKIDYAANPKFDAARALKKAKRNGIAAEKKEMEAPKKFAAAELAGVSEKPKKEADATQPSETDELRK